ncbi:MAG: alpha/beta family hydrolase [Xanthomonadales bacterium]|nr:alpha/beta family hydrolase [Xanthomonadales bacterium]
MAQNRLFDGPESADWTLILAHGAGAPMDHGFMNDMARGLGDRGIRVVRFEFPYMVRRRAVGGRRPPDRMPKLMAAYRDVVDEQADAGRLAIGGKSMGGRVASMLAAEGCPATALVCLGYPFHPPGKPERLRVDHLRTLRTPTLILQGTRDPFGQPDEVQDFGLPDTIRFRWLEDGDHSFKPRKASGHTAEGHLATAVDATAEFLGELN